MSDERIQIVIEDKVAPGIDKKISSIEKAARSGQTAIEKLKAAIKSIDTSAINALSNANARAVKISHDSALAAQRLRTEQQKTAQSSINTAVAQQKLQAATTASATAQQALATASQRAATEVQRTATAAANAAAAQTRAASAAMRLQQQQAKAAQAADQYSREATRLKSELFPLYAAQQQYNEALDRADRLLKANAIDMMTYDAAVGRAKQNLNMTTAAINALTNAQIRGGKAAGIHRQHLLNLSFQLQDIGVMLASGQNPLIILAQQGAQIQGIASQAGVGMGRLAAEAGKMMLRFVPAVALLGTFVGGLALMKSRASEGAGLEKFAKDLGATNKEIEESKLGVVTFGDTLRGLWRTIDQATGINAALSKMVGFFKKAFTTVLNVVANIFSSVISVGRAAIDTIVEAWMTFPDRFGLLIANAANLGIAAFEKFVNWSIVGLNKVIEAMNAVSPVNIDPFEAVDFGRVPTEQFKKHGKNLAQVFADSYMQSMEDNQNAVNKFLAKWQENSVNAAKERIKKSLEDENAIESRVSALAKINASLDNEAKRMFMVNSEREKAQKFDQIEEQLIGKKIRLTDAEALSIRAKIAAIVDSAGASKAYLEVVERFTSPAENMSNAVIAINRALAESKISLQDAQLATMEAADAYANFLNPLRQINRELNDEMTLLKLSAPEREVEQRMMQIRNSLGQRWNLLTSEQVQLMRSRLEALRETNLASQAEAAVYDATVGKMEAYNAQLRAIAAIKDRPTKARLAIEANPEIDFTGTETELLARVSRQTEMYDAIKSLRDRDIISERDAAKLRIQIWEEERQAKIQTASTFFSGIGALQNHHNKRIAKVGQVAAIAQATMDTYASAVSSYKAMAGIPIVGPALGAAAAAAAVIAGLENVRRIKSTPVGTGYMQGGYTGGSSVYEERGPVHGKEFVFDAPATARIGKDNLERLRSGRGGSGGALNVSIQNFGSSKEFEVQQISETEVRVIARDEIRKTTGKVLAGELSNPNSVSSKAITKHTTAGRKRD